MSNPVPEADRAKRGKTKALCHDALRGVPPGLKFKRKRACYRALERGDYVHWIEFYLEASKRRMMEDMNRCFFGGFKSE